MLDDKKKFGLLLVTLIFAFNCFLYLSSQKLSITGLVINVILLIILLFYSNILSKPLLLWIKFGELINKFLSPIIIGFLYFFIITPVGLILKLLKIDLLKKDTIHKNTYWEHKKHKIGLMKDQF